MANPYDLTMLGAAPADWMEQAQAPAAPAAPQPQTLADIYGMPQAQPVDIGPQLAAQNAAMGVPMQAPAPVGGRRALVDLGMQPEPPMAQPMAIRAQPARPAQRPAGGGFRGILRKEEAKRAGELQSAQGQLDTALQAFDKAQDGLVQTQQQGLEAQARGLDKQAEIVARTRDQVEQQRMLDEGERLLEQDQIAAKQAEIDDGYRRVSEMRVEDRRTPTQKRMAIAGMALAGIGDALIAFAGGRGNNMDAVEGSINQQIERDAEEQRRQIMESKGELSAKERALKDFLGQVGDARAQRQYLIAQQWDDLQHIAAEVEARTGSELKRNAATELKAMAEQQSAAAQAQGAQAVAEQASQRLRDVRDLGFELSLKQSLGAGKPKDTPTATGLRALVENPQKDDVNKAQEIASKSAGLMSTLSNLKRMAQDGATLSPTERKTASRRIMALGPQLSNHLGSGAPSETELKAMADIVLNPTEANLADAVRFFDQFEGDVKQTVNAQLRPYNHSIDTQDVRPE